MCSLLCGLYIHANVCVRERYISMSLMINKNICFLHWLLMVRVSVLLNGKMIKWWFVSLNVNNSLQSSADKLWSNRIRMKMCGQETDVPGRHWMITPNLKDQLASMINGNNPNKIWIEESSFKLTFPSTLHSSCTICYCTQNCLGFFPNSYSLKSVRNVSCGENRVCEFNICI